MTKTNAGDRKLVKPENAYEIWQSRDGAFTTYVVKKYQVPIKEENNAYARWHCFITSPFVPQGEYGDQYVSVVKRNSTKLIPGTAEYQAALDNLKGK